MRQTTWTLRKKFSQLKNENELICQSLRQMPNFLSQT